MEDPGQKLKLIRERLNLRYRDVEEASLRIAQRHKNDEFSVALSRLSDIENRGTVPSIYRLYSLCAIYRLDFIEVLGWYGLNFNDIGADVASAGIERTHLININAGVDAEVSIPLSLDPGIDLRRTVFLSRLIQRWGKLPLLFLNSLDLRGHLYGFVGTEDWFMYPVLLPGSLIVIDEAQRKIDPGGWTSENDRPIYFVEHSDGYGCGWCSADDVRLILQPHPASGCHPEVYRLKDVHILGRVTGVAMRLTRGRRPRTRS